MSNELMGAIGFLIVFAGAVGGLYRYINSQASAAISVATTTKDDLAAHKLHVAETYVSKQGHRESTDLLMSAITDVKSAIDGTNQRIDRMLDQPKPRRTG